MLKNYQYSFSSGDDINKRDVLFSKCLILSKKGDNMAIPQLTPEERAAALEKAKQARILRAQVREDLKSGKLSLEDLL